MKITNIKGINVCVPLNAFDVYQPVTQWYGTRYAALKTIIFIETDAGIKGLEECWADATGTLQGLSKRIIGKDPFDENVILREINQFGNIRSMIGHLRTPLLNPSGGISMALWDIIGKDCDKPIYKLIGGKYRDESN